MEKDIFCKIVEGEVEKEFLIETDTLVVFEDINPSAPVHYLIVPKKHISSLADGKNEDKEIFGELLFTASELIKKFDLGQNYKLIVNGLDIGHVPHLHLHIIGGWSKKPSVKDLP